jgi:nicotinamidase/pyrazinamidase
MTSSETTPRATTKTTLLLVDVQNDFHPGGSLAIPTADEDARRIAALITQHGDKIHRIVATLDSHLKLHIAHRKSLTML